jgi:tetratricopeptide (TPR) repeat protein
MRAARLLTMALVLAGSLAARADDETVARAHFITGQHYFDQDQYREALKSFREAYRLSKRPAFLYNIAICHERLDEIDAAIVNYERYVDLATGATDIPAVERHVESLKQRRADERAQAAARAQPIATPAAAAPTPAAVAATATPAPKPTPVYKRWWFWTLTVGAVAAVGLGVGLGVGLSGDRLPQARWGTVGVQQ